MRVLAFTKYGAEAASTRQRLLQYLPTLADAGIDVTWHALLDDDYVRGLVSGERPSKTAIAARYLKRLRQLAAIRGADVVWVYAELFPYLPAAFERLASAGGRPLVYDFDDAFFHQYDDNPNQLVRRLLAGKLEPLVGGAALCCCGNAYLESYAKRLNANTTILPTVVDTEAYRPMPTAAGSPVTIGWIGTPSTWNYVRPLLPVLKRLAADHGVRTRVIGAGRAAEADGFPGLDSIEWREDTEIAEVQRCDIGIMPLPDEKWARGKSGYKLIQYMACGLPVVASPVGVNREIVVEGETGFLMSDDATGWYDRLKAMIDDPALRARLGSAGRRRAEERYSLSTHAPRLVAMLRSVAG